MNKIDKLDKELEKAREKAAEWQAKIRELEKQKQEEENSQIVQAVRSLKLTPAQLMAFLNDPKNSLTASGHTDPKSGRSEWAAPFSWKGGMIFGYHNFVAAPCGRRRNDC